MSTQGDPTYVYATFEALRHWHFEPAMLDGRAVPSYYTVTVNYQMAQ